MKKTLLLTTILLASLSLWAQVSIPNGGFEKWSITKWSDPTFYMGSNSQNISKGDPINVMQTDSAYHGKYAVQLSTVLSGTDTVAAYFIDGNPGNTNITGGIPYSQKATGIRFYYKYRRINAKDSGLVLAIFKKAGTTIGGAEIKLDTAKNYKLNYTAISLPFAPDSIVFGAVSSCNVINNGQGYPGSVLIIDSVTFTGVSSQPAELNGDFESWQNDSLEQPQLWSINNLLQNSAPLQTTDAYTGTYALQLSTSLGGNADSAFPEQAATGFFQQHGGIAGGYPFANQQDTLEFYYKYLPAASDDSATVNITFKKNGVPLTYQAGKWLPKATSYTKVHIPFNIGSIPDSVIVTFQSSKRWPGAPKYAGAILKIDNVRFFSQSVPLVAGFNQTGLVVCSGNSVTFTDTTQNAPASWNWTFAGGSPSTSSLQNQSVTYSTPGTYIAKLVVTNSAGSDSIIKNISVVTFPPVNLSGDTSICKGSSTIIGISGADTYTWSTGSTNDTINVVNPAITATYSVHAVAAGGCYSNKTFHIIVNPLPVANFTATSACLGTATQFTDGSTVSSGTIVKWNWQFGDLTTAATQNPTHTYGTAGVFPAMLTITSNNGCLDSLGEGVTVNPTPTVTVSAGPPSICSGNSTTLTATGSGTTFAWIPATGLSATTGSTVTASPATTTTYTNVTTNSFGCKDTTTVTVMVNPTPTVNVTHTGSDTICNGGFLICPLPTGATTYNWIPSSSVTTSGSSVTLAPSATTTYTVDGTGSDGCVGSATITVYVNNCTGIVNIANTQQISVYPNPSNGIFNCELQITNDESKHAIKVYNVLGEVVYSENSITGSKFSVNLSDKSPGIYFYQLLDVNGNIIDTGKLIITE